MSRVWKYILSGVGLLVAAIASVLALLFYRSRNRGVSEQIIESAERQQQEARERAQREIEEATKTEVEAWNESQRELLQRIEDETRDMDPGTVLDLLRKSRGD